MPVSSSAYQSKSKKMTGFKNSKNLAKKVDNP